MWLAVSLLTDAEHVEALSDALMASEALSVSIEDEDAGTERETPQFGEPGSDPLPLWARSRVVALYPAQAPLAQLLAQAVAEAGMVAIPPYTVTEVAEQNWVQITQSQFEPICINDRLWIVPSWHKAPDPAAINLVLDPGMAFGTGSHPTTHLCLEWLCASISGGERVLDYGCGSGILAIAAAKLGAAEVVGVDIDTQALQAARDNAAGNQVDLRLLHSADPLESTFDRVVANILTNPLCVLAPLISARVADRGHLALSGILESQADQVIEAYSAHIELTRAGSREGWVLLEGRRA